MIKKIIKSLLPKGALSWYHRGLAFLGALYYGFPSRRLIVIGVTGTKGKTSTVHLIAKILEYAQYNVGVISGLEMRVGKDSVPNKMKMTMPGRFFIQQYLRKMVDAGCTYAVVEVTSEGIAQHRHRHIDFDAAVFTNIAPEHLEAHGSFEKYLAEKEKLFASLRTGVKTKIVKGRKVHIAKTIIVNGDDAHADDFLSYPADRRYACHVGSEEDEDAESMPAEHVSAVLRDVTGSKSVFLVRDVPFTMHLPGLFNIANALLAIAVSIGEGIPLGVIAKALETVKGIPGRMEDVSGVADFRVIVDYAHTPHSLDAVYRTIYSNRSSPQMPAGRLICVLGAAGGGRDRWKRPVLGAVAGMWCDEVIVTDEDPYDEDPRVIMGAVAEGVQHAQTQYSRFFGEGVTLPRSEGRRAPIPKIIPDRRGAIHAALRSAEKGDVVAITGKGSEQIMAVQGGKLIPWDDRQIVREELAKVNGA
ncbi:MAG: UDP-N-acetylmuramoyl-L-alanyl-D-glutamate--2,6-diaminopimelate ligase [bacterium]|nr:UDP-N-acetylmuramoyl-L-alanyl-D-glutamate--2,6-diaminopimelate ligase [bacterium]